VLALTDQTPKQLRKLPEEGNAALELGKESIQTLCDKVIVWADKRVNPVGTLDGAKVRSLRKGVCCTPSRKSHYSLAFTVLKVDLRTA
jgi:hypothetical protein